MEADIYFCLGRAFFGCKEKSHLSLGKQKEAFIGCFRGPVGRKWSQAFQGAGTENQKDVRNRATPLPDLALWDLWCPVPASSRVSIRLFGLQMGALG